MADISNNTLVTIVLFALAVTLLGTWVLYGKMQTTGLTANPTGTVQALVYRFTDIAFVTGYNLVNFSNVSIGVTYMSDGNSSNASTAKNFMVRNDGNVYSNVTIQAAALFAQASGNSSYYRYNVTNETGNTSTDQNCTNMNDPNTRYNMPISSAGWAFCHFEFADNDDYANVSIEITVPSGEQGGSKSSSVTLTASQA